MSSTKFRLNLLSDQQCVDQIVAKQRGELFVQRFTGHHLAHASTFLPLIN